MRRREFVGRGAGVLAVAATHPAYLLGRQSERPGASPGFAVQQADETRLYANENPYGPPPETRAAMREVLGYANRYGRYGTDGHLMEPSELEAQIAAHEGVEPDHVLVTHGATELLQLCAFAYGERGIAAQVPTYATILGYARSLGRPIDLSSLRDDYHYDFPGLREAVAGGIGCVYLCHFVDALQRAVA